MVPYYPVSPAHVYNNPFPDTKSRSPFFLTFAAINTYEQTLIQASIKTEPPHTVSQTQNEGGQFLVEPDNKWRMPHTSPKPTFLSPVTNLISTTYVEHYVFQKAADLYSWTQRIRIDGSQFLVNHFGSSCFNNNTMVDLQGTIYPNTDPITLSQHLHDTFCVAAIVNDAVTDAMTLITKALNPSHK